MAKPIKLGPKSPGVAEKAEKLPAVTESPSQSLPQYPVPVTDTLSALAGRDTITRNQRTTRPSTRSRVEAGTGDTSKEEPISQIAGLDEGPASDEQFALHPPTIRRKTLPC